MNKKSEYLKGKINELEMNSKNKNIRDLYRGINEFKWGYQPRSIFSKDENGDLLADSNTILNRWKSYFSQLLNVHDVSDFRQKEMHTAEPKCNRQHSRSVGIGTGYELDERVPVHFSIASRPTIGYTQLLCSGHRGRFSCG
jgi:hypothetical protein